MTAVIINRTWSEQLADTERVWETNNLTCAVVHDQFNGSAAYPPD